MTPFQWMLVGAAGAGACIPLGALLARLPHLRPRWLQTELRHFVMAFGGGVLLAAVSLVLLPQGQAFIGSPWLAVGSFTLGGLTYYMLARALGQRRRESPLLLATLLDYVPESLAIGGAFAVGAPGALLLALLIGLQNLPEGFNAYRELCQAHGTKQSRALVTLSLLVPLGPALAVLGWLYLATYTQLLGGIMLFAAGGLVYIVFQDIAPQSRLKAHWFPPLGAVCGFASALLGQLLIGA